MISFLQIEHLTKSYGELFLFEDISFGISMEQKVALIAKNGTGKSTLLRIIAGEETPDSGQVTFRNNIRIGYLPQNPVVDPEKTVSEQVFSSSSKIIDALRNYEIAIQSGEEEAMQQAIEAMDRLSAWDFEVQVKQILTELQIPDFKQKVAELSGGQKKRLALAGVLINEPDMLILDEPTNHLDLEMIEWLENYLQSAKITLLMVTHDRYFLDRVCNEIIELDNNTIYSYKGNYSYYLDKREERIQQTQATIEKASNLLRKELDWMRRMPKARGGKAKYRIDNFYKLKQQASQKTDDQQLQIDVQGRRLGKKVVEIYNISKRYDDNVLFDDFTYKFSKNEKIGIIGRNGTGKTTFLNMLTGKIQPDSGRIETGETVVFGYYTQSGIQFNENQRVIDIVKEIAEVVQISKNRRLTATQFLEYFLFPPEMQYSPVEKLSGGEKRRLYLLTVLMRNPNFLILDEPTNDLDILTLNVLEDYLIGFQGCVLVVSHDRYFMDKVVDYLLVFEKKQIKEFPGNYTIYRDDKLAIETEEKKQQNKQKEPSKKNSPPKQKKNFQYKHKRELQQIENELQQLQNEHAELEKAINAGELPYTEMHKISERFQEVADLIDVKEMRWLELDELRQSDAK